MKKTILSAFICVVMLNQIVAQQNNEKSEEIQNAKEQYENGTKTWQPKFYGDHQEWKLLDENKGETLASTTIDAISNEYVPPCAYMKYSNGPAFLKQAPQTIGEITVIEEKLATQSKMPVAYYVFENDDVQMANIPTWPGGYQLNTDNLVYEIAQVIKEYEVTSYNDLLSKKVKYMTFSCCAYLLDDVWVNVDLQTEKVDGVTTIYLVKIKPVITVTKKTFKKAKKLSREI